MENSLIQLRLLLLIVPLCFSALTAKAEETCAQATLCIETNRSGDTFHFYAINKKPFLPISGNMSLTRKNMEISKGKNVAFVLKGGERRKLFSISPKNPSKAWKYNFRFKWARGDFTAVHDANHTYALPYAKGQGYKVTQGCNGKFSHFGDEKFAIDFDMPIGTPIHASRSGKVVYVEESSNKGGPTRNYEDDANSAIIQHGDKTLGLYFHLRKDGVEVNMGDMVSAGDLIGYSGNTGFSSGPHLHFEVTKGARDISEDISLPVTFQTRSGKRTCLKNGTRPIAQ